MDGWVNKLMYRLMIDGQIDEQMEGWTMDELPLIKFASVVSDPWRHHPGIEHR